MARPRQRPAAIEPKRHEAAGAVEVTAADRVDPRANLIAGAPSDPAALLGWAEEHAPGFLRDPEAAEDAAHGREHRDAWSLLTVEEQRQARRAWRAARAATGAPPTPYPGGPRRVLAARTGDGLVSVEREHAQLLADFLGRRAPEVEHEHEAVEVEPAAGAFLGQLLGAPARDVEVTPSAFRQLGRRASSDPESDPAEHGDDLGDAGAFTAFTAQLSAARTVRTSDA